MASQSLAERYRAHREAFTLALELGCTPREAEAEIARRRNQERARLCWLAADQRLQARTLRQAQGERDFLPGTERDPAPWMMRD